MRTSGVLLFCFDFACELKASVAERSGGVVRGQRAANARRRQGYSGADGRKIDDISRYQVSGRDDNSDGNDCWRRHSSLVFLKGMPSSIAISREGADRPTQQARWSQALG